MIPSKSESLEVGSPSIANQFCQVKLEPLILTCQGEHNEQALHAFASIFFKWDLEINRHLPTAWQAQNSRKLSFRTQEIQRHGISNLSILFHMEAKLETLLKSQFILCRNFSSLAGGQVASWGHRHCRSLQMASWGHRSPQALLWSPQALLWSPQALFWSPQALFWRPQALFWSPQGSGHVHPTPASKAEGLRG